MIKAMVTRTCLGTTRMVYKFGEVTEQFIDALQRFGKLSVYSFQLKLVKITSNLLEISFVIPSDQVTITYKDRSIQQEVEFILTTLTVKDT